MVTDRKLFSGQTEVEILKKVRDPKITPPSQILKEIPPELEKIILKALDAEAENRYQDAGSMKRALDKFLFKRKVALGSLNLGGYVQNLFQDEFKEEYPDSPAHADLPSLVISEEELLEEEEAPPSRPAPSSRQRAAEPPPARPRATAEPSAARVKKLSLLGADASDDGEVASFDKTMLSPQGAPTWLYGVIFIALIAVFIVVYLFVFRHPKPSPGSGGKSTEGASLSETSGASTSAALVPAVVAATPVDSGSAALLESPTPLLAESPGEPSPEPTASNPEPPEPTQGHEPSRPTPRAKPTPRPTSTPKPAVAPPMPAKSLQLEPSPTEPVFLPDSVAAAAPSPDPMSGAIIIKRAQPRPTPVPESPVLPTREPSAPEAASAPPANRPARENDLVDLPDTPLEFTKQAPVEVPGSVKKTLKKALGDNSLNIRFFVRAEISIKGQVTRIDTVLKSSKDVPQLAGALSGLELSQLDQAFLDAVNNCRFKPLMKDGVKVRSVQTIFLQARVP